MKHLLKALFIILKVEFWNKHRNSSLKFCLAMDSSKSMGAVDYVIFGCLLLASSVIGIYFGYKHRKQMTSDEYLLASRSVSWIPICISIVVSFFSSVGVMGVTSNMYVHGMTFGLGLSSLFVPIMINSEIFAPIFRGLKLVSVNEVSLEILSFHNFSFLTYFISLI